MLQSRTRACIRNFVSPLNCFMSTAVVHCTVYLMFHLQDTSFLSPAETTSAVSYSLVSTTIRRANRVNTQIICVILTQEQLT